MAQSEQKNIASITNKVLTSVTVAAVIWASAFFWKLTSVPDDVDRLNAKHDNEMVNVNRTIDKLQKEIDNLKIDKSELSDRVIILETRLRNRRN
jgi:hypothetical protein